MPATMHRKGDATEGSAMRIRMPVLTGLLCLAALGSPGAQEIDVDLELVLAVDVSRSMDATEQKLQKDGYIAALQHPEVVAAIRSGFLGRIAVTYVEWAGPSSHAIIAPWAMIDGPESAAAFASAIGEMPVSFLRGTSISGALTYTAGLFDDNGFRSTRQVIDVSGDGPNNVGFPVLQARAAVLERGITINGLPIMIHADYFGGYSIRELDIYYEDCVIGGPGAFVVPVRERDKLKQAIRRKLVLEIASLPPQPKVVPAQARTPRTDCLIGEKLWRERWGD